MLDATTQSSWSSLFVVPDVPYSTSFFAYRFGRFLEIKHILRLIYSPPSQFAVSGLITAARVDWYGVQITRQFRSS